MLWRSHVVDHVTPKGCYQKLARAQRSIPGLVDRHLALAFPNLLKDALPSPRDAESFRASCCHAGHIRANPLCRDVLPPKSFPASCFLHVHVLVAWCSFGLPAVGRRWLRSKRCVCGTGFRARCLTKRYYANGWKLLLAGKSGKHVHFFQHHCTNGTMFIHVPFFNKEHRNTPRYFTVFLVRPCECRGSEFNVSHIKKGACLKGNVAMCSKVMCKFPVQRFTLTLCKFYFDCL